MSAKCLMCPGKHLRESRLEEGVEKLRSDRNSMNFLVYLAGTSHVFAELQTGEADARAATVILS